MPHLDSKGMDELLSGEHGVLALQAARELKEMMEELKNLRDWAEEAMESRRQETKALNEECMRLSEKNNELEAEKKALVDKVAVLIDIRKELGLDKPDDKKPE